MKKLLILSSIILSLNVCAQESTLPMLETYNIFKQLQPYIYSKNTKKIETDKEKLSQLVSQLRDSLDIEKKGLKKYKDLPGFSAQLEATNRLLDETSWGLREDKFLWSQWRLQGVTNRCLTCHASYKVDIKFHDVIKPNIDDTLATADFYFASRQYDTSEKTYTSIIDDAVKNGYNTNVSPAINRLLSLNIKVNPNPKTIKAMLEKVKTIKGLPLFESYEIDNLINSVDAWIDSGNILDKNIKSARELLSEAIGTNDPLYAQVDTISALRTISVLHKLLEGDVSDDTRAEGLYLLGLAYTKVPKAQQIELPEYFLEDCIRENPNSDFAKKSFNLYKEYLMNAFTGSGGMHIPTEIRLKIDELFKIAHGIHEINERV